MTNRERERMTLDFQKPDRGSVEETFYPWVLSCQRFKTEGMPAELADGAKDITNDIEGKGENDNPEKYMPVSWGEGVMKYEEYFGFDPVRRFHFVLPFRRFEEKIIQVTDTHVINQNIFGRQNIRRIDSEIEIPYKHIVTGWEDWEKLKEHGDRELELHFSDEALEKAYLPLKEGHDRGDYPLRLNIEGFFWTPRELLGDEEELLAFYEDPDLIHDMNEYILHVYQTKLMKVIEMVQPDVVYIMEDLSGKNGPMISGGMFDEFVGHYYRQLIPMMKERGVGNVFVDTDGDFMLMIPHFMDAGVDGFLPMDVNAGMDIVKVRENFPTLKFIGGFNKLQVELGKEAVDKEFDRILPVVRQGGYIVGNDHQLPPSASIEDYRYYIARLKDVMAQCGADL